MTLRVAVDPLNVVLRKATPDVAEKLTLLIAMAVPLKVTFTGTFWGLACPPETAVNWMEGGFAVTPVPLPVIFSVTETLTEPRLVVSVSIPV